LSAKTLTANKLTVCLPVYNGARYLEESVRSVLDQNYTNFEFIICDDCSTDDSPKIIENLSDDRLIYVRNPERLGLVRNWNKCVTLAKTDYVYLWHQDDIMLPGNLKKKVEVLDANPTVGFVHSNIEWLDQASQEIRQHWAEDSTRDYLVPGYFFFLRNLRQNSFCCPSAMIRAECYKRLGYYREELPLSCDTEFFMRVSLYYDVACIGEPLIRYRWHSASETHSFIRSGEDFRQVELARRIVLDEHADRVPDPDLARETMMRAVACDALRGARTALSTPVRTSDSVARARGYCWQAIRRNPGLVTTKDFWWILSRLMVGYGVLHEVSKKLNRYARKFLGSKTMDRG
jgi:glycosyltransferase involved in cell wall biosynthesis